MTVRPAAPDTASSFAAPIFPSPWIFPRAPRTSASDACSAPCWAGRGARLDGRAPDVRVRGPRHRQCARRSQRRPKCRSWTAAPAPSSSCCSRRASRSRSTAEALRAHHPPVRSKDGDKWAQFDPFDGFKVNFEIEFNHPIFKRSARSAHDGFLLHTFLKEVSRARTFGFMRDLETLRAHNLALGGNLDNAIVLDDSESAERGRPALRGRVREAQDPGCHRRPVPARPQIIGEFSGFKSGHDLNNRLLRALLADPTPGKRWCSNRRRTRRSPTWTRRGWPRWPTPRTARFPPVSAGR
jgi:UDP-3-O-[3-hydroxymyristoyl] N-acetylglucosamine deacetylase